MTTNKLLILKSIKKFKIKLIILYAQMFNIIYCVLSLDLNIFNLYSLSKCKLVCIRED